MNLIKFFGLICVAIMVVQSKKISEDEKEMVMMFTEDCRKTHKATDEDVKILMGGKIPETKSAKCTMACAMKQFKAIKEDKMELDVENIVKMIEAQGASKDDVNLAREVTEKCKAPPAADECEFAVAIVNCYKKEGEARGIDVNIF